MVTFSALTDPNAPAGPMVRRYISSPKTSPWLGLLLAALPGLFAAAFSSFAFHAAFRPSQALSWPTIALFVLVCAAMFAGIPLIAVLGFVWKLANTESVPSLAPRLPRFALDNGWQFSAIDPEPAYPGNLFAKGTERAAIDHIRSVSGRFFDFGDFRYVIPGSESDLTTRWGFVAIDLGRPLPHMIVEATLPGFPGWKLPFPVDRSQALSLEGDFDQHFTLYCPADYEQDALYIFAPDLMSLLLDNTGGFHVEIIDHWFFLYAPKSFEGYSAEDYERLIAIIELVGTKALRQTGRYVDHRAPSADGRLSVTARGRRLRPAGKPVARAAIVATILGVVVGILVAALPV